MELFLFYNPTTLYNLLILSKTVTNLSCAIFLFSNFLRILSSTMSKLPSLIFLPFSSNPIAASIGARARLPTSRFSTMILGSKSESTLGLENILRTGHDWLAEACTVGNRAKTLKLIYERRVLFPINPQRVEVAEVSTWWPFQAIRDLLDGIKSPVGPFVYSTLSAAFSAVGLNNCF